MKRLRFWWLWVRSFLPTRHKQEMHDQASYTRGYEMGWTRGRESLLRERPTRYTEADGDVCAMCGREA